MKYDETLIKCAELWAKESYCIRLQVGAVLSTKDGRILATGYNGTIKDQKNDCEDIEYTEDGEYVCQTCKGKGKFKSYSFKTKEVKEIICQGCRGNGYYNLKTNKFTLHAEQNLISFCAKNGISTKDTYIYITHSPCYECSKLIAQSGISRVVYLNNYRNTEGIDFLKKIGIEVIQFQK